MASPHRVFNDMGRAVDLKEAVVIPTTNVVCNLDGMDLPVVYVPTTANVLLPNQELGKTVRVVAGAAATATVKNAAASTIATLTAGQSGLFMATATSGTWNFTPFDSSGVAGALRTTLTTTQGVVPISLFQLRIVSSAAIGTLLITDATPDTGGAGLIASTTAPTLGPVNGATDARQRVAWAANVVVPVMFQTALPLDIDSTQPIYLKGYGAMGGVTDTFTLGLGSYFGDAGAVVSDSFASITDVTNVNMSATIAAADYAANYALSPSVTCILTPGAHANDAFYLYNLYFQYTKKLLTS